MVKKGYRIELTLTHQQIEIDVAPPARGSGSRGRSAIYPTLADAKLKRGMLPAATLLQKAKQFDDGLSAAVELAAQNGAGDLRGMAPLLRRWITLLSRDPGAGSTASAPILYAALRLGEVHEAAPPSLAEDVEDRCTRHLANPLVSRPLGFHGWSDALTAAFRQGRFLQSKIERSAALSLARGLHADPDARAAYVRLLELAARLTGPLTTEAPDLRSLLQSLDEGAGGGGASAPARSEYSLFPPSSTLEGELLKRRLLGRPTPEDLDVMAVLVAGIRAGKIDLSPAPSPAWYAVQLWALETLVAPHRAAEARRLRVGAAYRAVLEQLFRGAVALTRETHALRAGTGRTASPRRPRLKIEVGPGLHIEPLVTLYLRRALSYRLVRGILEEAMGTAALRGMHRLTPEGPVKAPLSEELPALEGLFHGAALQAASDLGMTLEDAMDPAFRAAAAHVGVYPDDETALGSGRGRAHDLSALRSWRAAQDPDVGRDARMMMPIAATQEESVTKVWVFLGWSKEVVRARFARPPGASVTGPEGEESSGDVDLCFVAETHEIAIPVTAELDVTRLRDRAEMRAICDRHKTKSAILSALRQGQ